MQFETANGVLIARNGGEMLRIEPWGKNSLRVRATMLPELSKQDWALTETPESSHVEVLEQLVLIQEQCILSLGIFCL